MGRRGARILEYLYIRIFTWDADYSITPDHPQRIRIRREKEQKTWRHMHE